jgi:hypothetical protein
MRKNKSDTIKILHDLNILFHDEMIIEGCNVKIENLMQNVINDEN